ncbi:MAG: polysaccharide deacetylase family protein [Thermovirgaceae bacterium]
MTPKIALKVDVDTLKGYLEGVPNLLGLLGRFGIQASFFFTFGPDNSGKAVRRIFRKGFLKKMARTNAPGTYGVKTMLYGTLLPAPIIVPQDTGIFRRAISEGHECGIHAWDHVEWQDRLDVMDEGRMRADFGKAVEMYTNLAGRPPGSCAAPGWKVTPASLAMQDEYDFTYCSDTRGTCPFLPVMGGRSFRTPQVPSTLPTMDEIYGRDGIGDDQINNFLLKCLTPGLNVHTIHAEMEGRKKLVVFESFLTECLNAGYSFVMLEEEVKELAKSGLPACEIRNKPIPGRAGSVAFQHLEPQAFP